MSPGAGRPTPVRGRHQTIEPQKPNRAGRVVNELKASSQERDEGRVCAGKRNPRSVPLKAVFLQLFFPSLQTQESHGATIFFRARPTARAHLPHLAEFRVALM